MSQRRLISILIFAVIAILVGGLGYWNFSPDDGPARVTSREDDDIDFYVLNATTTQYQEDGQLRYTMTTDKAEHLKSTDITLLDNPKLDLSRGTEYPWKVSSRNGEVSPGGEEVELIEDVRVARTDERGRSTVVTSSRMTVFPDKDYAETAQPVRIEAANGVTTATGMKAYFNDSKIELQSKVRGQHEVR